MSKAPSRSSDRNHPAHAHSAPPPVDARDAAYRVLSAHARTFPDLLPVEPETHQLDPRDRALCHAIIRESVTRWITLRHIVSHLAGRGFETIEPRMQAVLVGGAAQLLLLDRLPPHAVINESVEWAKTYIRPKAGGMTNAILRKVARAKGTFADSSGNVATDSSTQIPLSDGRWLSLHEVPLPTDEISNFSVLYSIPKATIKRWKSLYPDRFSDLIAHTIVSPPTVLYSADWQSVKDTDSVEEHTSSHHRVYSGPRAKLASYLDEHPQVCVQDSASSVVVQSIPDGNYQTIIDYCAGQGTKTRQLAERFPDAQIIAMEIDSRRLDTLMDVFDGSRNVIVRGTDELDHCCPSGADLILTDVPCTNSGVLARRMEARYRPMTAQTQRLTQIQREILETVVPKLRKNGVLVYSTCSIEQEENQDQRDWIKQDPEFEYLSDHQILPAGLPGQDTTVYSDASYACIFRRNADMRFADS
ncbi:MAG: hypothetical protein JJ974_08510 [Phycisphaerales bacterium]|nr:hypothetical protein [Phycisphaerales bacterium]